MRIRLSIPDHLVTPAALEAALEATTLANAEAIARGEVSSLSEAIADGVKWKPEPFLDGEHFDLAHQVVRRGWGDCDDLAPWLAAELRHSGEDAGAIPRIIQKGKNRFHAVVETSDGQILDPSRWAGMGRRSAARNRGVVGMIAKPFARANQGAACVIPGRDGKWWARADLPWPDAYGHLASHARARTPEEALDRAIGGAIICGGAIDSPLVDRLRECGAFLLSEVSGDPSLSNAQLLAKYARDFHHEPPQKPAMVAFLRKRITPDGKWQRGGPKNISPTEVAHLVRVWMGAHGYTGDQARATPDWKAIERYVFTNERTRASMDSRINEALHRGGGFLDDVGDTLSDVVSAPVETISDAVKGKGALGYVVNPVSAATRAAIPKKLRRKYDAAMNSATGRAADMIAPGSSSLLSSLARGEGKANVPGAVRDGRGVSVPLRRAKKRQEEHDAQGGMTLYYHPAGSIGPVVVRF